MSTREAAYALLEQVVNRYLRLDPTATRRLADLHGRVILLEVLGLGLNIYLVPGPDGIQLFPEFEGQVDCVLRGTPAGFARLGAGGERADRLFEGSVEMRGDTETGHRLGDILADLDIDWEEQLARLTGDLAAHQLGRGARAAQRWGRNTVNTLTLNMHEYLQEEARLLPSSLEVTEFISGVDTLRDDMERLEARTRRLARLVRDKGATSK